MAKAKKGKVIRSLGQIGGCVRVVRQVPVKKRGGGTRPGYFVSKVDKKCGVKKSRRKRK